MFTLINQTDETKCYNCHIDMFASKIE